MRPRFHLLHNDLFSARISGGAPSEADRKKLKSPKLKKDMLERDIYPQLGAVIRSVLKAAKCKTLSFSHVSNNTANGDNPGSTDIFYGTGIYRDAPLARQATLLNSKSYAKSKEKLKNPMLGARSCFWVEVPIEVMGDESDSAFYFRTKPKESWSDCMHSGTASSRGDEELGDVESQEEGWDEEMREEDDEEGGDEDGEEEEDEEEEDEDDGSGFEDDIEDFEGFGEDEDFGGEGEGEVPGEQEYPTSVPAAGIIKTSVPPFVKLSDNGLRALDQFIEYQHNVFKYQHRTFCYSIYVCFDMARLLYFDRAGAYVSEPFSWVETASLLHEFVWKFAQLANANKLGDMGHDTTAKVVSLGRRRKFVKEAQNPALAAHIRAGLKKAAANDCPLYELTVEDVPPSPDEWFPDEPFPEPSSSHSSPHGSSSSDGSTSKSTRRFIVGRPHFSADALVGRCTKGYMAFDVTNPKKWVPCFLKDSWRPYIPNRTRPEHSVYERLHRVNVEKKDGIATLICGGDVGGSRAQCTRVQEDLPRENRPVLRVHYRLVIEDIGLPLSEFRNFGELSSIFANVLKAHHKVWKDAKVLHRDVSIGNIMIRVDGEKRTGFLIDWDLSCVESELGNGPVKPDRTGTWQFRSAVSLRYPRKPYRRSDDIESFIHAFVYLVLRYHVADVTSVKEVAESLFEQASLVGGIKVGGELKFRMLHSGEVPFGVTANSPLQSLLLHIFDRCYASYSKIDTRQMQYFYGPENKPQPEEDALGLSDSDSDAISDDEISQASDVEDEEEIVQQRYRMRLMAQQSPPADLCTMGAFLTSPRTLVSLFANYARRHSDADDKAPDQFVARRHEDIYHGPVHTGSRGIATLSTSASVASNDSMGGVAESDMFVEGWSAPAPSSVSPNVSTKKRAHPTPASENGSTDEEGEGLSSERHVKRTARGRGRV